MRHELENVPLVTLMSNIKYKMINVIVMKCLPMKSQLVIEPKFAYYIPLEI